MSIHDNDDGRDGDRWDAEAAAYEEAAGGISRLCRQCEGPLPPDAPDYGFCSSECKDDSDDEDRLAEALDEAEAEFDGEDDFADPGGRSALRAATPDNPRDQPCPSCGEPNRLTPKDVALSYVCDQCADHAERGW